MNQDFGDILLMWFSLILWCLCQFIVIFGIFCWFYWWALHNLWICSLIGASDVENHLKLIFTIMHIIASNSLYGSNSLARNPHCLANLKGNFGCGVAVVNANLTRRWKLNEYWYLLLRAACHLESFWSSAFQAILRLISYLTVGIHSRRIFFTSSGMDV